MGAPLGTAEDLFGETGWGSPIRAVSPTEECSVKRAAKSPVTMRTKQRFLAAFSGGAMERTARDRAEGPRRSDQPVGNPRAARSAPELAVLLLELASIVKARAFFAPGDAKLAHAFERCLRTWRSDLARHGQLELAVSAGGFREIGGGGVLQHARLADLLDELRSRGVKALCFEREMDGDALAGFVNLLADASTRGSSGEAFAARLRLHVPVGISLEAEAIAPEAHAVRAPAATPLATPHKAAEATAPTASEPELPVMQIAAQPLANAEADSDTLPLDAPVGASSLDALLDELGDCQSAASYLDLTRRAITEAERARDAEVLFRVIDLLAEHVEAKEQRLGEIARSFLTTLCQGAAMSDLLERAARGESTEQIRAAQILALVGEAAAVAVLDRMSAYPEPVQRERLVPLLLALGDRAVPELMERLERVEREHARTAVHVLGMMQHPGAVARLSDLALGSDPQLREEAARALVRIGSEDAIGGLARALRGDRAREVVISSIQHLGGTASAHAVAPLGHALERALEAKDVELSKEILRALGRVGRPEANLIFGSLMRRKAGLTGRWLKDVKVAAASALATVPGDQAVALLAEALESREEPLRKAAQRALDRRAESVARGPAERRVR